MKYIISKSDTHGIGCFAKENIVEGEIVGKEPYFILSNNIYKNCFEDYCWSGKIINIKNSILINGLGNWCNHSDNSNLKLIPESSGDFILFVAKRNISKGEELFNNYGPKWWKNRKIQKNIISENKNEKKPVIKIPYWKMKF